MENECLQYNLIPWENLVCSVWGLPSSDEKAELLHQRQTIVPDLPEYFGFVSFRLDLMSIKAFMKNSICGVHITEWECFLSHNCEQI